MRETGQAKWFCANRDCGWSVELPLSDRDELNLRCVCGWPLKRANPPVGSHYLEFLRTDETSGNRP